MPEELTTLATTIYHSRDDGIVDFFSLFDMGKGSPLHPFTVPISRIAYDGRNFYGGWRCRIGFLIVDFCDAHLETIHALDYKDLPPGQYVKLTASDTDCG
jgi:hypothetical protein